MKRLTMDDRPSFWDYLSVALVAAMMGYALAHMV
jgi:hypothetical protein